MAVRTPKRNGNGGKDQKKWTGPTPPAPKIEKAMVPEPIAAMQKPEMKAQKMEQKASDDSMGSMILNPFKRMMDFAATRGKEYYIQVLKIALLQAVAGFCALIMFGIIFAILLGLLGGFSLSGMIAGFGVIMASLPLLIITVVLMTVAVIIIAWIQNSIELTAILYTKSALENKEGFRIIDTARSISGKTLRYVLLSLALMVAFMIPLIALLLLGFGGSAAAISGGGLGSLIGLGGMLVTWMAIIIYVLLAMIVLGVFTQFWRYGFLLEGMGVYEALKNSVKIVCRKPAHTILFDILFVVGFIIVMIPLGIASTIVSVVFTIVQMVTSAAAPGLLAMAIAAGIYLLRILVNIVIFTVGELYSIPTHYLFWKGIKDKA